MKTRAFILAAALAASALPTAVAAQETVSALRGATRLYMQSSVAPVKLNGTGFQRIARISGITVPAGSKGFFVATFGGESACQKVSAVTDSLCSIRIACDGVPLLPDQGADFTFNSHPFGLYPRSLSVTRRSAVVNSGTHTCDVLSRQTAASHLLDEWTFTVEFWRQQ